MFNIFYISFTKKMEEKLLNLDSEITEVKNKNDDNRPYHDFDEPRGGMGPHELQHNLPP